MNRTRKIFIVCAGIFLCFTGSFAQVRTFSPEKQAAMLKDTLRLTAQQAEKVLLILQDVKEEFTDLNATLRKKPEDLRFAQSQVITTARKRIMQLLREDQAEHFKEIELLPNERALKTAPEE